MESCVFESPKRSSASSSSSLPEFEFWKVGSNSECEVVTADELFVDGVLLPLHLLSLHSRPAHAHETRLEPELHLEPEPEPAPDPTTPPPGEQLASSAASVTASISCSLTSGSKRWRDILKVGEKKGSFSAGAEERRKERKSGGGGGAGAAPEQLNINIWPFSRSRSAGNGSAGGRPRAGAVSGRTVSSAPCSRSNSRGESSKPVTSAASPGTAGGVHVGGSRPAWPVRRRVKAVEPGAGGRSDGKDHITDDKKASGLNLNVNSCIGYRGEGSCTDDDTDGLTGGEPTAAGEGNGSLFSLRALFSKKVY